MIQLYHFSYYWKVRYERPVRKSSFVIRTCKVAHKTKLSWASYSFFAS